MAIQTTPTKGGGVRYVLTQHTAVSVSSAYVKLVRVKHFPAVLLGMLVLAVVAAGLACGDDKQPQIGSGPADDIDGVWFGTYIASDGSQSGSFCVNFEQDNRGITGQISFNGGEPTEIGGVITENTFLFTWGAGLLTSPDPNIPVDITLGGGTMNGTVSGDTLSGTWIAAASVDVHGDWTATRLESSTCG